MRVAVTGSSGLLGRTLVSQFKADFNNVQILGLDVLPPKDIFPTEEIPHQFEKVDISVSASIEAALKDFLPEVLIHLAFVVDPIHDYQKQRKINVDGTKNVLAAAARLKVKQLMVASSAAAYGAWSTNPLPIKEGWPTKGNQDFQYSAEKAEIDNYTTQFATDHPHITVSIIRPCIILGPNIHNFISESLLQPFQLKISGANSPLQFVDVEDVAAAAITIIKAKASGPFNVAPPDLLTDTQLIGCNNKTAVTLPFWLVYVLIYIFWFLGLPFVKTPAGIVNFQTYPWVIDSTRLCELGFKFRYSSAETRDNWLAHVQHQKTA